MTDHQCYLITAKLYENEDGDYVEQSIRFWISPKRATRERLIKKSQRYFRLVHGVEVEDENITITPMGSEL